MSFFTKERKGYYQNSSIYKAKVIMSAKQNNAGEKEKRSLNITQLVTIAISVSTLLFSIHSYNSNQFMTDKRKYYNQYYDEKYKVLKDLTKSVSEITYDLGLRNNKKTKNLSDEELKNLSVKSSVFSYSLLVLNPSKENDSTVLSLINDFKVELIDYLTVEDKYNIPKMRAIGDSIALVCGIIINKEKDSINSFKPKFLGLW